MLLNDYSKMFEAFREFGLSKQVEEIRSLLLQSLTGEASRLELLPKLISEESIPKGLVNGEYFCAALKKYLLPVEKDGVPYRNFASDPAEIIQIKNLLNALYHTQMALEELEGMNASLSSMFSDGKTLWSSTIYHAYQASFLFTQVNPDILVAFTPEINNLKQLMGKLQEKSEALNNNTEENVALVRECLTAYKAGKVTGVAISQMGSQQSTLDFGFLTNLFAQAPEQIDKLTQVIQQYSGELVKAEANIDEYQIQMLQDDASIILHGLEDLYNSSKIVKPFKVLRYIHLLSHIASVTNSIIEQVNYANASTQDAIVSKMCYLKYDLLQELFILSDKIEDYGMLEAGVLSKPLMQTMERMYDALNNYVQKVVNFDEHDGDLRHLNDSVFKERRLDVINQRLMEQEAKRITWTERAAAFDRFYEIIDAHPDMEIQQIPEPARLNLIKEYREVQDLMRQYDKNMHARMMAALFPEDKSKQGWGSWLIDNSRSILGKSGDKTNWLQTLKADLKKILSSQRNSILFRIEVASTLSQKINAQEVVFSPYRPNFQIHAVNERTLAGLSDETDVTPVKESTLIDAEIYIDPENPLSAEKANVLSLAYQNKCADIEAALQAYQDFCYLYQQKPIDDAKKTALLSHYRIFQAWLHAQEQDMTALDKELSSALASPDMDEYQLGSACLSIIENQAQFQHCLAEYKVFYSERANKWSTYARHWTQEEQTSKKIEIVNEKNDTGEKIHYSKKLAEYRSSLLHLRQLLSPAMQKQLEITNSDKQGLPYPEMENPQTAKTQAQQVAAIKRIYNCLYYLEGILAQLEKLDPESNQSTYVYHLIMSYSHIIELQKASMHILNDPYCQILTQQFVNKIQDIYEHIQPEIEVYQMGSEAIESIQTPVQYTGLWYAMNAFMVLPEQMRAKKAGQALDVEVQSQLQQQAKRNVVDIERIINDSGSYFKLFLDSPKMVRLMFHFRSQIKEFTGTLHTVSMENLKNIDTELFFSMLKEADEWEQRLGVKPGLLSEPLEQILDKFYLGLIEALELSSEEEFSLLFNSERISKRKAVIAEKVAANQAQLSVSEFQNNIQELSYFMNTLSMSYSDAGQNLNAMLKNKIADRYSKVQDQFAEELASYEFKKTIIDFNAELDRYTHHSTKKEAIYEALIHQLVEADYREELDTLVETDGDHSEDSFELYLISQPFAASKETNQRIDDLLNQFAGRLVNKRELNKYLVNMKLEPDNAQSHKEEFLRICNIMNIHHNVLPDDETLDELIALYSQRFDASADFRVLLKQFTQLKEQAEHAKANLAHFLNEAVYEHLCQQAGPVLNAQDSLNLLPQDSDVLKQKLLNACLIDFGLDRKEDFQAFHSEQAGRPKLAGVLSHLASTYAEQVSFYKDDKKQQVMLDGILEREQIIPAKDSVSLINFLIATHPSQSATLQLANEISQNQLRYCEEIEQQQIIDKAQYRKDYIAHKFDTEAQKVHVRYIGLDNGINTEYQKKLSNFLYARKEQICLQVTHEKDIRQALALEIDRQTATFAIVHYQNYAHLNAIMMGLETVTQYCNKEWSNVQRGRSVYENEDSLRIKQHLTEYLKAICKDDSKSPEERIAKFNTELKQFGNASALQAIVVQKDFSMLWLKQWCFYLLSLVGLYQTASEKNYKSLCNTAEKNTRHFSMLPSHHFFSNEKAAQGFADEAPDAGIIMPTPEA